MQCSWRSRITYIRGYRYADKSKVSLQSCEHLIVTHYSCNTFNEAYARLDFENVM